MTRGAFKPSIATLAVTLCVTAAAKDRAFGSWIVSLPPDNETVFASTVNESGGQLAKVCHINGKCMWLLINSASCENGSKYPVLVNSTSGAASMTIVCIALDTRSTYAFADFESIDSVIQSSQRLGIAFPMRNGQFQVSRFSLEGASVALSYMSKAHDDLVKRASNSTADQTY